MSMSGKGGRPLQDRVIRTRRKIVDGAIRMLATHGVSNLTHRMVARAAGVSLAATTYHYATKQDILADASRTLLEEYLEDFRRLEARLAAGEETGIRTLDDLVMRVVARALGRERERSLAWCELILHGGRNAEGRALAQDWYTRLDRIWADIGGRLPAATRLRADAAVDLAVGFTFLLHPLALDASTALDLIGGHIHLDALPSIREAVEQGAPPDSLPGKDESERHAATRERLVEATIGILVDEGAAAVSYAAVAERAGMVRSGPSYYFPTMDALLRTAQTALFTRAKARYRAGIGALSSGQVDKARLADLTTAIFFHELLQFPHENLGYYSTWLNCVQNSGLRPVALGALVDLDRAWARRLQATGEAAHAATPLWLQALFVGKLVRGISARPDTGDLSRSREDFATVIEHGPRTV